MTRWVSNNQIRRMADVYIKGRTNNNTTTDDDEDDKLWTTMRMKNENNGLQ